jgi:hypothetical protein
MENYPFLTSKMENMFLRNEYPNRINHLIRMRRCALLNVYEFNSDAARLSFLQFFKIVIFCVTR